MERVRLGILGGVFDPPHAGHVALAQAALEQLGLERLLVLVVACPGHKDVATPAETRLALTRLAFAGLDRVDVELDRHARTVDFLEERGICDAIFVLGGDELASFATWKRPERVLELVRLGVARRPGTPDEELEAAVARLPAPERVLFFELDPLDISSSEVRERVARGDPIDDLVPAPVAAEIARLGLYRAPE
ncbi:MAG: putative nicotinate-nucleotide adenylyltransferase [Gaiellaceae bacterium]|nr:MAG: putative nicotinate-nucleotide adenylyltransferase [Gaiellaceae bacterium]